jgi:salicylate 5-hydroxylase small subunit
VISETGLHRDLVQLLADYAACLDDGGLDAWPDFFTEDGWYRLVSRENYRAGLPLSTMSLQGQPMMRDRLYGIESTLFYAPYFQRHIIGPTRIAGREGEEIVAETNYLVVRTKRDAMAEILSVGVYVDRVRPTPDGLKFVQKFCVFDNDLIPNSIIYPI